MSSRKRICLLLGAAASTVGLLATPATAAPQAPAATGGPVRAVTYQISPTHAGFSADSTIVAPLGQRWSRDLGGPVSYPLIAQNKVFVTVPTSPGQAYGTTLYALDQATGATVWSQSIPGTYYWSAAAFDGARVFVVNTDGLLRAFTARTGAQVWAVQLPGQYLFSSPPTADGGVVYVGGAGSGGTLYAVRETDGAVLWTASVMNGDDSSPALTASSVIVSYACGLTYSFDRTTGQQQWFNDGPCEGGGGATPVVHGGRVYTRDFFGNEVLNARTGTTVGSFDSSTPPVFAGDTEILYGNGVLRAERAGGTAWTFDATLTAEPIVVGNTVYAGAGSTLYGLDLTTGATVWSTTTAGTVGDSRAFSGPTSGLGAGQGLLVVPAGNGLAAYGS